MSHEKHDAHAKHEGHDMSNMPAHHGLGEGGSHHDHEAAMTDPRMAKQMEADMRRRFWIALILTIPIVVYSPLGEKIFRLRVPSPIPVHWLLLSLTTPVVLWAGSIFITGTYYSLKSRKLNMSVLIATGVLAAYLGSIILMITVGGETFFDAAAMLVTFVLFGHWMEMKSRRGTTDALRALFALAPPQARIIKGGKETMVPTSEVKVGDIVIIKPGDKIPVDGVVMEGETAIDESLVTGESIPVEKIKGDKVIGGSINQAGYIKFEATKVGEDTALAQIVKLVEIAQNSKAPGQKIADRFAQYLVIVAVGGGLLTFSVWFFVLGQPILFALTFAISTIVIACPDALGLATPTAVAVGTGLGAKHNILIKDATTLEQTSKIQAVVLDKTGTLTAGKPVVTDIIPSDWISEKEVLSLMASVEAKSSHPLSKAVLDEAERRKINMKDKVERFKNISGHGVEATVLGKEVLVGTIKLMKDKGVRINSLEKDVNKLLSEGKTIMILAVNKKIAGVVAAQDPVKPTAAKTIARMQELGLEVAMITGDNQKTGEAIGKKLGIDRVFAEVLPEDKAKYVKKLQEEGKFVAMVGDGVNDAPALAQSDIGIAIGAGTDVAIETAKIVLMKSEPADVLRAIRLSKATVRKMKENLFWASIYNLLAIPVAAGVLFPKWGISLRPEVSALLMSASSIIVATNAILLNRAEKDLIEI